MTVPAGIQSGTILKLKSKGLPYLNSSSRGNQLITIRVATPSKLTDKQKELLKQFKEIEDGKKKGSGFFKF